MPQLCQALTGNCLNDTATLEVKPGNNYGNGKDDNTHERATTTNNITGGPKMNIVPNQEGKTESTPSSKAADKSLPKDSTARRICKGKTRFASPTVDMAEGTVLSFTVPEARALLEEQDEDSDQELGSPRSSRPQNDLDKKSKLRSRSLTPAKHEFDERATNPTDMYQSHQSAYTTLLSDIRKARTECDLCHRSLVVCANYCPCNSPTMNQTNTASRHQRHPQNCQACLQHLNALRAYRTLDSETADRKCDNHTLRLQPARTRLNLMQDVSHQFNCTICSHHQPVCHVDNNQALQCSNLSCVSKGNYQRLNGPPFRYGYRKGRLALLANEQHGAERNSENISDTYVLDDQTNKPRSENGHSRGRSKENKELIEITKMVEEEIRSIHQSIRMFLDRIAKKDTENVIIREWRTVAMVMDRIFFVCYLLIHLCAAFGLLVPNSHEADVVGFLRDYRLKNYNATYMDGEAMGLGDSKLQNSQPGSESPRMDKPSSVVDRQISNAENLPDDRVHLDSSSPLEQQYSSKLADSDPPGLLVLSPLSPYQRLVDEHSQGSAGTDLRKPPTGQLSTPSSQIYEDPHGTN